MLGGPLYQLLRRTHLSDDALALVHRRVLAGVMITWVPLLVLSLLEGQRVVGQRHGARSWSTPKCRRAS